MRWVKRIKPAEDKVKSLAESIQVDDIVAVLLVERGIETYEAAYKFFRPKLGDLHNPYLMKDMDKAVERIELAIKNEENILIFGDYDVDGTTAVSLLYSYLRTFYSDVATYIPDRYAEGYGISFKGIDFAEDNGFSLIIALDCGIKSNAHVDYAKKRNIDFIICDHHRPGDLLPEAVAILDPKRVDCTYPYDELCGCGIGFKLIQALGKNRNQGIDVLITYLDLVATAIAADIVPMTGENRILAYFGLKVINSSARPGIKALTHQLKKETLDITDIVFTIAPRINAAGRVNHGNQAVALLTEFNFEQAQQFALEIETYNCERKDLDKKTTQEALLQIKQKEEEDRFTTVVFQKDWHKGVIGIVASRLIENFYRPTLVFTESGDKYAASARSVKGFDIYNAIEACSEHLEQFGGHKYAAGLTLLPEKYQLFKDAFEKVVQETIHQDLLTPEIVYDIEINFSDINPKLIRILKQFEPFGPENRTPVFLTKNVVDTGYGKTIGTNENHLKLYVKQNNEAGFSAIGFDLGNKLEITKNKKLFEAVYCIDENIWNGTTSIQLRLKDIQ